MHLDVGKEIAQAKLENEDWVRLMARLAMQSQEQMRATIREFLGTDGCSVSIENYISLLGLLLESWDIDLATFRMEIVLNPRLVPEHRKRFAFVEQETQPPFGEEPGLKELLRDPSLSNGATEQEIAFLKRLRFQEKRPTSLYYYRELQNLRDSLNFRSA
jgi:hypothetical protein